jgi:Putative DNA-binding domain
MQNLRELIEKRELPLGRQEALSALLETNGNYIYIPQEGPYWDFKREWPFSYSDGYFGGISRLICAFANSMGGIIVFGVHDESRTPGHNRVTPNLDKLQQALNQLLTDEVSLRLRRYDENTPTAVDVLLVNPLPVSAMPVRFKHALAKYSEDVIWVRQRHEVLAAEPRHVPMLYCRTSAADDASEEDSTLSGSLPPSPSTISTFVGRVSTIDKVFRWIKQSDEPRNFLHGKGGSGKTTVAYQIARTLRFFGASIRIQNLESRDNIIFVSAKQTLIETMSGQQATFLGRDFSNERELYEAILTLGNWTAHSVSDLSITQLKEETKEFFDLTSNFVVIDDIDTLTTQGIEAGFDFLYALLWRSKRKSKILYTLRNAPTQSLANAIEVPGLEAGGEYERFVDVCASQFKVSAPPAEIRDHKLAEISERRPLVVESIIAIRRTTSNYGQALVLFEQGAGEDIRAYVFQREWSALSADNFSRYILTIMSLFGAPLCFSDLTSLSRYDEGRVRDALSEVREMFLKLNEVGNETTYELGALTRAFISEHAKGLERYEYLRERVKQYKKTMYPENPVLTRLRNRIEGLVEHGRRSDPPVLVEAWRLLANGSHPASVVEDPRFMDLQGFVAAMQSPPKLDDARRLFSHSFAIKREPDSAHLRAWYLAEREWLRIRSV